MSAIGLGCSSCNSIGVNSILGGQQNIKYSSSDIIATSGPNTFERLILSDLRIPYKQILKSRILLKPGQQNYLLNYLGLGDNATFVTIYAKYNQNSRTESNNYLEYHYAIDPYRSYFMSQILTLSGNSTHRIPQLYISNPNQTYEVTLDVMVAIIDDESSFFNGFVAPPLTNAIQFLGLRFSAANGFDIQTYTSNGTNGVGQWETFAILNSQSLIVAFLNIDDILTIQISGAVIIIDDASNGVIYLQFISSYDAAQAYSAINYAIENRTLVIPVSPTSSNFDDTPPLIIFTQNIDLIGGTFGSGITYSSTYSTAFIANTISLSSYSGTITKLNIGTYSISSITDNRDGVISFTDSMITILDNALLPRTTITVSGTYSLIYTIEDLAGNPTQSSTNFTITLPIT